MRISDWSSDVCSSDLSRVPMTRDFPDDFGATLRGHGAAFMIEMTTTPGCAPCGDLWAKLTALGTRYGWQVRTISGQEAMIRSGRLGLPWVGHPVAWVRPRSEEHTSELQSLMRISYAVFCLKKKK